MWCHVVMVAKFVNHNNRKLIISNSDGEGNENGKKVIGLYKQNNNFACASHFFTFLSHYCTTATWNFLISFFFSQLRYDTFGSNPLKFGQHLTNWMKLNKINEVWNSANSLFKWHFQFLLSSRNFASMGKWYNDFSIALIIKPLLASNNCAPRV